MKRAFSVRAAVPLLVAICSVSLLVQISFAVAIDYGVDISFPMHHPTVSTNYEYLPHNALPSLYPTPKKFRHMPLQQLGDRNATYTEYMEGCTTKYSKDSSQCVQSEQGRIVMNLRQPRSMINYTDLGFQKVDIPATLWSIIQDFWGRNQENWKPELWPDGNTYTNHWKAPTYLVNIEDAGLRGGGSKLKRSILDGARVSLQEWTGQELTESSLYGIRIYTEGAMLNSHVDQLPLVSSAIINVAQDIEEPWPLELIAHDGKAYNITLEPGEMLLYESHSVIHGRPYALNGQFVANLFVHFEPIGHSLLHHDHTVDLAETDVAIQYRKAVKDGTGGHEATSQNSLPPYLLHDSTDEARYRQEHPEGFPASASQRSAHTLAAEGRTIELIELVEDQKHLAHAADDNGWTPLHEGARSGHVDVVKFLVEQGADIHIRTYNGTGGSALFYAQLSHGSASAVFLFLESLGGVSIEPDPEL